MRNVIVVAEQQLKRVFSGRQFDNRFGLPATEMPEILVGRQRVLKIDLVHVHPTSDDGRSSPPRRRLEQCPFP